MAKKKSSPVTEQPSNNLTYGVVASIVFLGLILFGVNMFSHKENPAITEDAIKTSKETHSYTVKEGDSLWSIAEKKYKDGYAWPEIAKANKIENPDAIEKGDKLTLPELTPTPEAKEEKLAEAAPSEMKKETAITGKTYTVVRGDTLWDIAVRAYGDGYRWVDIAKTNKLVNPDLIHAGNKFNLPR